MYYRSKPRRERTREDCLVHLKGNFSKKCADEMIEIARNLNLPLTRAIAIAVDNELETAKPFDFPIPNVDDIPYVEDEYYQEGGEIEKYIIKNWSNGIGIEMLLLCRKDFNIPDKTHVVLAVRELMKKHRLSEIEVTNRWTGRKDKVLQVDPRIRNYVKTQRKYKDIEVTKPIGGPLHEIDEKD